MVDGKHLTATSAEVARRKQKIFLLIYGLKALETHFREGRDKVRQRNEHPGRADGVVESLVTGCALLLLFRKD